MHLETQAVHAGRRRDTTGAVAQPIHLSTTFERAPDGEYPSGFSYSREANPNRQALERCLAVLENGKEALAFSSGLAVTTAIIQALEPGDHILAPLDVYYGLRKITGQLFAKWPIETSYVDTTDLVAVQEAIRPNTRLIWIESPSNPLLHVTDLAAVGSLARRRNIMTVCDSTFASPVLQRPFDFDIDLVFHSTTKYISGHSDVTGGVLITRFDNYLFERCRALQQHGGGVPSPFDCWLALRGVDTLPYRVRAQSEHALQIATFLARHPAVEVVHYPGLPTHPGHAIAARQMSSYGGMLSFQVRGCKPEAMAAASRVQVFTRATSLGGTHSLIEHRASVEGLGTRTPQSLLRLSIGLEHPDDLQADLEQALAVLAPAGAAA